MNRRKAIGGMLVLTGIGFATYTGIKKFDSPTDRGQLIRYSILISELVEVIIPTTQTPGAKQAKVHEYIIHYMETSSSSKEYRNFIDGLIEVHDYCVDNYLSSFEKCTWAQKNKIVSKFDSNTEGNGLFTKIRNKMMGRPFFTILKTLTIEGYCTSKIGATQHLAYELIPARYNAITTITPQQKSWATR